MAMAMMIHVVTITMNVEIGVVKSEKLKIIHFSLLTKLVFHPRRTKSHKKLKAAVITSAVN